MPDEERRRVWVNRLHDGRGIPGDTVVSFSFADGWMATVRLTDPGTGELVLSELSVLPEAEWEARHAPERVKRPPGRELPPDVLLLPLPSMRIPPEDIPSGGIRAAVLRQLGLGEVYRSVMDAARVSARAGRRGGHFSAAAGGAVEPARRSAVTPQEMARYAAWYLDANEREPNKALRRMVQDEVERYPAKADSPVLYGHMRDSVKRARDNQFLPRPADRRRGRVVAGLTPKLIAWLQEDPSLLSEFPGVLAYPGADVLQAKSSTREGKRASRPGERAK